jgi:2-oxoglutarate ferredoxin oxidoreductase subunit beta
MWWPDYPVPVGVLRAVVRPTHDQLIVDQIAEAKAKLGEGDLAAALAAGETWTVE